MASHCLQRSWELAAAAVADDDDAGCCDAIAAKKENKTTVVALCEANRKGSWLVIHSEDLDRIIDERRIAKSSRDT